MKKLLVVASLTLLLVGCGKPGSDVVGTYVQRGDLYSNGSQLTEVEFLQDGSGKISACCTMGGNRYSTTFTWSVPEKARMHLNLTYYSGDKEEAIGSYKVENNGTNTLLTLTDMGRAMSGVYIRKK